MAFIEPNPVSDNTSPGQVIKLKANAWDREDSITEVRFYVDGALKGVDKVSPYSFSWSAEWGDHRFEIAALSQEMRSAVPRIQGLP